jgi:hypothetical protein
VRAHVELVDENLVEIYGHRRGLVHAGLVYLASLP